MQSRDDDDQSAPRPFRYHWLIWVLALAGAVRVLAFAAAYPPFHFIDEGLHYENVVKYAQVGLPGRGDDLFDIGVARTIGRYSVDGAARFAGMTPDQRERAIEAEAARVAQYKNAETFTPPLYYALAGGWYRVGRAIGIGEPALVYWVRFLAAPLYGLTIWLAGRLCLRFHAQQPQVGIAAACILAALPQDILYTVNSDVASPLAVALVLYLIAKWLSAPRQSIPLATACGLAAAGAMLVKYTNVAAPAAVGVAVIIRLLRQRDQRRGHFGELLALSVAAALPLLAWFAYCQVTIGDWTAAREKAAMLGWTRLSLSESLKHPIFGPLGMIDFASRLLTTFWRGELVWGNSVQRVGLVDTFYVIVTALGAIGTMGWLLRPSSGGRGSRPLALVYFVAIVASVAFLGLVSTWYDYGRCFFPSRGFPYFAAGRLLTGVLAPFAILLAGGLNELLGFTGRRHAVIVAAGVIAVVCMASEIYLCCFATDANVFASPHNFYRLLSAREE